MNFLTGSAKLAIWLTRKNKGLSAGCVELVLVLKGVFGARLRVEYDFYRIMDNMLGFSRIFTVEGVLCSVGEEEKLFLNF